MDGQASPRDGSPNLPEQRVGAALRNARLTAGWTLRSMAQRLNYGSHSTLSEYEKGARMPSEAVVEGYERLLQLKPGTLMAILEAANIERHGDAWTKRRIHLPPQHVDTNEQVQEPKQTGPSGANAHAGGQHFQRYGGYALSQAICG